jgi:hypothetical protein
VVAAQSPLTAPAALEASESLTAPEAVEDAAGSARGVTMQLDVAVWRGRLFWRLAVKATVRFFRP